MTGVTGFNAKEIVDEATYNLLGEEESWKLLDVRLKATLSELKAYTDWTIIINTWSFKNWQKYGAKKWVDRCYRSKNSTTGKIDGAHYKGMGVDFDAYDKNGNRISPDAVRQFLFQNIDKFPYIRCFEIGINWVHIDVMGHIESPKRFGVTDNMILLYHPKNGSKVISKNELRYIR